MLTACSVRKKGGDSNKSEESSISETSQVSESTPVIESSEEPVESEEESVIPSETSVPEESEPAESEPAEESVPAESTPAESEPAEESVPAESEPAEESVPTEESEPGSEVLPPESEPSSEELPPESEPAESEESLPAKITPVVTIKYLHVVNTENGGAGSFADNAIPDFTYEIDVDDATVEACYVDNSTETEIEKAEMVAGGTYAYRVIVTEDAKYNQVVRWVWFTVISGEKVTPVITIKYGEETNTANGGVGSFKDNAIPDFTYEIDVNDATVEEFYQKEFDDYGRVDKDEMEAGYTYSYHVNVLEDDDYNAVARWVWFNVISSAKTDPVITIKYGEEVNTTNTGIGSFPADAIPDFTYEIDVNDATVEAYYVNNDTEAKVAKADMVAGGTYAYHVHVTEDDNYNAVVRWVWFTVTEATPVEKTTPVITIKYGEVNNTENGGAGSFKDNAIPDFTYEIDVNDATVEAYYVNNDTDAQVEKANMVAGGTYAYRVIVTEDAKYNAVVRWVWFTVISGEKVTPVITIKYGEETNTANGGAGSFEVSSIPDFNYEIDVNDATVEEFYMNNDTEAKVAKADMVAGGTYAYHVHVTEDDNYNAVVRWVWFTVVEDTPSLTYYVVGSFNSWGQLDSNYAMTVDSEDANHYTFAGLELQAGQELKCMSSENTWYPDGMGNNEVAAEPGVYTVHLHLDALNEADVIVLEKTDNLDPVEVTYYLTGSFNGWTTNDENCLMTVDSEDSNHYTIVYTFTEACQIKVVSSINAWYGDANGDNFVVESAGEYIVNFYIESSGNSHITLTPAN